MFGATGGTGRLVVRRALEEGHLVTAVARRPEAVDEQHPGLEVVKGDVMDPRTLKIATDTDAVVYLVGPTGFGSTAVYTRGVENTVEAMTAAGVKRAVIVTNGLVNTPSDGFPQRLLKMVLRSTVLKGSYDDHVRLQKIVHRLPLDWTVVRPPRLLDSPARGVYRTALDVGLRNGLAIGRADLADAVLQVVGDPKTYRHAVDVAY
ncbi:SDR family oxidoreductase [Nonomuraea longicatena]|uniref:SDR family oxidoreductase n=1 Tax=Nonomuraea longicatena TaxID=83682 RepID=A0ABN1QPE1_9ACTN